MNKELKRSQYTDEQQQIAQNIENAKNILAASMMAQSLNCCLEKKYLDTLSARQPIIEVKQDNLFQSSSFTPISWMKIEQVGKPAINGEASCFFYIQKILHSCAIPNRRLTFLVVGNGVKNDIYLGLRDMYSSKSDHVNKEVGQLQSFSKACWPGLITRKIDEADSILKDYFAKKYDCVTAFTGIPTVSDAKDSPVTTIEQLMQGMQSQEYAYLVTADPVGTERIDDLLMQCRELSGQLESVKSVNITQAVQNNITESSSETNSTFENWSESESDSISKRDYKSLAGGSLLTAGLSLAAAYFFPPALSLLPGANAIINGTLESSTPLATFLGLSGMSGMQLLAGFIPTKTHGKASSRGGGSSRSITEGISFSKGASESVSKTLINKHVEAACRQLATYEKRYELAKATGAWNVSCYLFTQGGGSAASLQLKSLLSGEDSSLEPIRAHNITGVLSGEGNGVQGTAKSSTLMIKYVGKQGPYFSHPFGTDFSQLTTLLTTRELSAMVNFPLNSVSGVPVVEHTSLAKEVIHYNSLEQVEFDLGCVFDYGLEYPKNRVKLQKNSLTKHIFVTGSTGCGKSETVYRLIDEARLAGAKFLIIEPAKGEYKNVFGNVNVYGTNPRTTKLLHINPFQFPTGDDGIHVLEHIDRLVEIFNVCWPMYAAMPAVLKKAVLSSYEKCGWDLALSTNRYKEEIFPTFADLLQQLEQAIEVSAYSEEVKSNYTGSLVTRVESLTNGINGEIFSSEDYGDKLLFDENTIVDLSRIGSQETKSLIMGILIMRLNEYRMSTSKGSNNGLRHITVLEEAHNILKRTSTEQSMEGSNVAGKSVEMITNAIAEMRTYGESFVIVDQSPTSVAPAAIKNTNTKIIMRLPDGIDRDISGKAASMKDCQIDEIAKLPTGVAVVYQNDWVAPVLCKVDMYGGERVAFTRVNEIRNNDETKALNSEILKMLICGRVNIPVKYDSDYILKKVQQCRFPTSLKMEITNIADKISRGKCTLWNDENFSTLSNLVVELLSAKTYVELIVSKANDFKELDAMLDRFVSEKVSIEEKLMLVVRQCLMMQYGEKNDSRRKIYNAWFIETKKQLLS